MTDKMDMHKIHDLTSNSAHTKVSQITVYRNNTFFHLVNALSFFVNFVAKILINKFMVIF